MPSADSPSARLGTRLSFLVAGFGIGCWAPMVPYAKDRLGVDEGMLGGLLLCLGAGSVLAMFAAGGMSSRFGARPVIVASGFALAAILPFLTVAPSAVTLGFALLLFGAALGSLDVAMNIHAVEVERDAARPLMSGFHALFSIGGFAGAAMMTLFLSAGIAHVYCGIFASILMVMAMIAIAPRLLRNKAADDGARFATPRGAVLVLAGLAAITFLAEGALLDWSALLITQAKLVDVKQGGLGYMLFAVTMTGARLAGDALTTRIGDRLALFWGGIVAVGGFAALLLAPVPPFALAGFVLIGLGSANIVPVLFRRAGSQTTMPPSLAIAAITTTGYAGILLGPAAIGLVARYAGLAASFWLIAALLCLVPILSRVVVPANR